MDIDLQIEGVVDRRVADAIRRRVRVVRREFARGGEWRVAISPSETRDQWDVGVRGTADWQLTSFAGSLDDLPAFVERSLRTCVQSG